MDIYWLTGLISACGAVGGVVNCLLIGARGFLPGHDAQDHWQPGWVGNIVLGAAAAVVIWGIYGASASFDLLGTEKFAPHLTVAQLLTCVVVGMGGSRILTNEVQKQILRSERNAAEEAKKVVTEAFADAINQSKNTK